MKHRLSSIVLLFLVFALMAGCAHPFGHTQGRQIEIVNEDLKCGKMEAGKTYVAPMNGWFVSDEGVQKMLGAIRYFHDKWLECDRNFGLTQEGECK